jgi:pimeloyl-ACP methyl ester carboxylesterase
LEYRTLDVNYIPGFPDSFLLWRNHLKSPALAPNVLIAVDLPGYGGSDGPQRYDADGLLDSLTAFILGMREQYLGEGGKVVMVTHDWGAILSTRLASEAKELADRWIICSAVIVSHIFNPLENGLTDMFNSRSSFNRTHRRMQPARSKCYAHGLASLSQSVSSKPPTALCPQYSGRSVAHSISLALTCQPPWPLPSPLWAISGC